MRFTDYLNNYVSKEMVSFHMPGHKGRGIFDIHGMGASLDALVAGDITEIPGSDNLAQPHGIIRDIMDRYKALYESEESFISVGGSTLGIMASIMAASAASSASRVGIAIARNSHKSVFNGVQLAGAQPIYIYPEIASTGIAGEIKAEAVDDMFARAEGKGIKVAAVVIPNPNYYGICSDIKTIAEITHRHKAILIVDQAHGAHLRFLEPRLSADTKLTKGVAETSEIEDQCAVGDAMSLSNRIIAPDIVIESTHKTLASFTQTAIINVYNPMLVDVLEGKIKMLQSTSPSYILMKSLDMNAELIERFGEELFESWNLNLDRVYKALDEMGVAYFKDSLHDRSKVLIDMSAYGMSGAELSKELFNRGIVTELDSGPYSMCMTGIGNSKRDYERLIAAIDDVRTVRPVKALSGKCGEGLREAADSIGAEFAADDIPRKTENVAEDDLFVLINKRREMMKLPSEWEWRDSREAVGLVCAESIVAYPPGIPLIAAGEVMDYESLLWAEEFRKSGGNVLGMNEKCQVKAEKRRD